MPTKCLISLPKHFSSPVVEVACFCFPVDGVFWERFFFWSLLHDVSHCRQPLSSPSLRLKPQDTVHLFMCSSYEYYDCVCYKGRQARCKSQSIDEDKRCEFSEMGEIMATEGSTPFLSVYVIAEMILLTVLKKGL